MANEQLKKFNFTKQKIEGLKLPIKPGAKDYYYDTKVDGLAVRVMPSGAKTFCVYKWVPGVSAPTRVTLGRFASEGIVPPVEFETDPKCLLGQNAQLTVDMARIMARAVVGDMAASRTKLDEIKRKREELSLGELFQEYLERHAKKKRKTWEEMERCFYRWFDDWKDRGLSSITQADVERMHGKLAKDRGQYAANRALELVRAVYNKGLEWKLFQGDNPARGITEFEEQTRERTLEGHELEQFFSSLNRETDDDIRDFVMLALLTGARRANVLGMRWKDVSSVDKTWRIPAEQSKNSRSQTIPLTEVELEILERRYEANQKREIPSSFVFPGTGRTGHLVEPKKGWKRILERAGIEDLHIHDLRRSLASWMANTGANVAVIKGALNHQDVKTTLNVYARVKSESELAAKNKAHATMFELGKATGTDGKVTAIRKPSKKV